MSAPRRLALLLRSFRLPETATAADLRSAYLREAKHLHPDLRPPEDNARATRDFSELKKRFDEANAMLGSVDPTGSSSWFHQEPSSPQASTQSPPHRSASGASWYWEGEQRFKQERAVPTVGLPAQIVYTLVASLTIFVSGIFILTRNRKPDILSAIDSSRSRETPVDVETLRKALEGGDSGSDPSSQSPAYSTEDKFASYSSARARRGTRSRNAPENFRVEPQIREGVHLEPIHVAAEDGRVWWLDRCGASPQCRATVNMWDRRGDTPLHHAAREGQYAACQTLLRIGADPLLRNRWKLSPEDLAANAGHASVVSLLSGAVRAENDPAARRDVAKHPDGLGVLAELPDDVGYSGPHPAESLRHAVNMAAGSLVIQKLTLSRTPPSDLSFMCAGAEDKAAEIAVQTALLHARDALEGTGFELDSYPIDPQALPSGDHAWRYFQESSELRGLLVFEPPGSASSDAPGHWVALRSSSASDHDDIFRLDSVRGPYRLTSHEFSLLLSRYRAWRMIRSSSE